MRYICSLMVITLLTWWFSACAGQTTSSNPADSCLEPHMNASGTMFIGCSPQSAFLQVKKRSETNDSEALYMLGRVYEYGGNIFGLPDIKENLDLAQKYYLRSARLGNVAAEEALGWIYRKWYQNTRGMQGIYWQCKAAIQKNTEATINIKDYLSYAQIDKSVSDFCELTVSRGEPNN